MSDEAQIITTGHRYTGYLEDKDVLSFSIHRGSGAARASQDMATLTVPARLFEDYNWEDDQYIKVRFGSGQTIELKATGAQLEFEYNRTVLVIVGEAKSYDLLERNLNKMVVFAWITKAQHEAWEADTQGKGEEFGWLFGDMKVDTEYELKARFRESESAWTNVDIIKELARLNGLECVVSKAPVSLKEKGTLQYAAPWHTNIWGHCKSLFPSNALMTFTPGMEEGSGTIYIRDLYAGPINCIDISDKPPCQIQSAFPVISQSAIYELEGGMVDLRPDKYKWGNIWTQLLDPSEGNIPVKNTYLQSLMNGEIPEDFFKIGRISIVATAGGDAIMKELKLSTQKHMNAIYTASQQEGKGQQKDGILATKDTYKDRMAWNASICKYFCKVKKESETTFSNTGTVKTVHNWWIGYNALGRPLATIFDQVFVWRRGSKEEPRSDVESDYSLCTLEETLFFYEGIGDVKTLTPRLKCQVMVRGQVMVQLRPDGFDEGSFGAAFADWSQTWGAEYGHRDQFFNSTAAEEAMNPGSEKNSQWGNTNTGPSYPSPFGNTETKKKAWIPQWVWEPNAAYYMKVVGYDEQDYRKYEIEQRWAITYEDLEKPGNEKADAKAQESSETNPFQGRSDDFGDAARANALADEKRRWERSNETMGAKFVDTVNRVGKWIKGDQEGYNAGSSNAGDKLRVQGGSTHELSSNEDIDAEAAEEGGKSDPLGLQELAKVGTRDKYDSISSSLFHYMILTHGGWSQDPRCIVSARLTYYSMADVTKVVRTDMNTALEDGKYYTWTISNDYPYNSLKEEKIEKIKIPCHYSRNWPVLGSRLATIDAGIKNQDRYIDDWAEIDRLGGRQWKQLTSNQRSFMLSRPGSLLIPVGTQIMFITDKRTFLQDSLIQQLDPISYTAIVDGQGLNKTVTSMAMMEISARDVVE